MHDKRSARDELRTQNMRIICNQFSYWVDFCHKRVYKRFLSTKGLIALMLVRK